MNARLADERTGHRTELCRSVRCRRSDILYGLTLSWTATAYNLMLMHLVRSEAFLDSVTKATIAATVRAYRTGWIGYAIATLPALWLPVLSFAAYLAIALYYLIPRGVDSDIDEGKT